MSLNNWVCKKCRHTQDGNRSRTVCEKCGGVRDPHETYDEQ